MSQQSFLWATSHLQTTSEVVDQQCLLVSKRSAHFPTNCWLADKLQVFYSTKTIKKEHYPIPKALNTQYVLGVLHDHSMLSQVFWPPSLTKVLEEKHTDPSSTKLLVGLSNVRSRAKLTAQTDGVVCTKDISGPPIHSDLLNCWQPRHHKGQYHWGWINFQSS